MTLQSISAGIDRSLDDGGPASAPTMNRTPRQEDTMNFVIYSDNGGDYHWRLDSDDGKPVAPDFRSSWACARGCRSVIASRGAGLRRL